VILRLVKLLGRHERYAPIAPYHEWPAGQPVLAHQATVRGGDRLVHPAVIFRQLLAGPPVITGWITGTSPVLTR
jgi:hypothetical protein